MNIGSIMDMIQKDPSILDDIDGFVARTQDPALAEKNAGPATREQVLIAMDLLANPPVEDPNVD